MGAKLDMGKAWNDAVALLSGNKDVVLVVAGMFFFLPSALFNMFVPQPAEPVGEVTPENMEAVYAQLGAELGAYFASYWWVYVLLGVIQSIGVLGLMSLLTDRSRPTVGEALQVGAGGVLTYFAVQLLVAFAFVAIVGTAFAISPVFGSILALPALVAALYVSIKLCLTTPVIAIERLRNPISVMQRSWSLTKGNSLRIFAFFALLILVLLVLSALASGVFALFAMLGEGIGTIIVALLQGLLSMVTTMLSVAVIAALYHQLSGRGSQPASDVFE